MDEEKYYLAFSHFLGIGPVRFKLLLKHFGTAEKAYCAKENDLIEILGETLGKRFLDFRKNFDPIKKIEDLRKKAIEFICLKDDDYPSSLKNIEDSPICLYVKGNRKILNEKNKIFFAIVGTRKPSNYGIEVAKKISFQLAKAGFIIISGMAIGIDTLAHWGCLKAGEKTIAVLGCGVDIIYPAINRQLYEKIIKEGGAIISEFPPGQMVAKGLFIARNRIISGLSAGVLVIEGLKDSGALITARYAGEQGKEVFAVPSPINLEQSQAPNILIKNGAKLVTGVEDIFEELGLKITPKKVEDIEKNLTEKEWLIFNLLKERPLLIEELVYKSGMNLGEVLNLVSILEIKKVVEKNKEGRYEILN